MSEPIFINSPLELKASSDAALPEKIQGVAYTGAVLNGFGGRFIVDLGTTSVAGDMPLLNAHNPEDDIGVLSAHSNDGTQLSVEGSLFSSLPGSSAEQIAKKAKLGAKYQMSIGIYDFNVEQVSEGKDVSVNGQDLTGPVSVYRGGHIREVSVVTLGWDKDTAASFLKQRGNEQMKNEELQASVEALTAERDALSVKLQAAADGQAAADEKIADLLAQLGQITGEVTELRAEKRKSVVLDALGAAGIDPAGELVEAYCKMSQETWDGVAAGLALAKPQRNTDALPDGLFQSMGAPADDNVVTKLDMSDIYAKRHVS